MLSIKLKRSSEKTEKFFEKAKHLNLHSNLDKYGKLGVQLLSQATPVDTGLTSDSWYYTIENDGENVRIIFCNSNIQNGVPIAIILDTGHGTGTGGWVTGRHYIDPAIQPLFDKLADDAWREVKHF